MNAVSSSQASKHSGFSLIEVVLALGIFLVSILALIGLLGPSLKSIDEVETTDEIASLVNTLNTFLHSSSSIDTGSNFNAIYSAVAEGGYATALIYRYYEESAEATAPPVINLEIGFESTEGGSIDSRGVVNYGERAKFENAAGPIYRIVLSPSSVTPTDHIGDNGEGSYPRYTLNKGLETYPEGYFAMEARIFRREADQAVIQGGDLPVVAAADLAEEEPIFTYNLAVVR